MGHVIGTVEALLWGGRCVVNRSVRTGCSDGPCRLSLRFQDRVNRRDSGQSAWTSAQRPPRLLGESVFRGCLPFLLISGLRCLIT